MTQLGTSNFVNISAGYKFRQCVVKPTTSLKSRTHHKRNSKSSLKIYRAYDKQRLLEQIDDKLCKQQQVRTENKILKAELNRDENKNPFKISHVGQARMMLQSLQIQNQGLQRLLSEKNIQLQNLRKTGFYTKFLQILTQYKNNKQELSRLKTLIRQQKQKKCEKRKMRNKILNEQISSIETDKRNTIEKKDRNEYFQKIRENMKQQITILKDRNSNLERNKRRLKDCIEQMKKKMNLISASALSPKLLNSMRITKIYEYSNIFDEAIKKKCKKSGSLKKQRQFSSLEFADEQKNKKNLNQNKKNEEEKETNKNNDEQQIASSPSSISNQTSNYSFDSQI